MRQEYCGANVPSSVQAILILYYVPPKFSVLSRYYACHIWHDVCFFQSGHLMLDLEKIHVIPNVWHRNVIV